MEVEFKTRIKPKFTAGDIVTMKVDSNFNKTKEVHYYLIGKYNGYFLTDIKTGDICRAVKDDNMYFGRASLGMLLNVYGGKIYSGDNATLVMEENK